MSHWLVERMFRVLGLDAVFPGAMAPLLEMGFKYTDLVDVVESSDAMALMTTEWLRKARFHETAAAAAEHEGNQITACESYHRAALCYARARWGMASGSPEIADAYSRLITNYDTAAGLMPPSMGRVTRLSFPLPSGEGQIGGNLHVPARPDDAPLPPVVIVYPGMDMAKEYYPGLLTNPFTRRGLAVLTLDPPGHGQSLANGVHLTLRNVEATGSAVIDALAEQDDVDGDRIAVMGVSFGSYFAMSHAAEEPRILGVLAYQGGVFHDKRPFLAAMPPTFNSRLRAMTGLEGDDFESFARDLTVEGREDRIQCHSMIMTGEWDEQGSLRLTQELHERIAGPSSLLVYEGEGRLMGGVTVEATARAVDWLAAVLDGSPPAPCTEWVPSWKRTEVPSPL